MATALMEPSAPRLVLRQWRDADRQPFAALNADPLVMEHLLGELTRAQSDAMVDRCIEQIDRDGYGLWAVEVRTSGEFIGFVGLAAPTWEAMFTPAPRSAGAWPAQPGVMAMRPRPQTQHWQWLSAPSGSKKSSPSRRPATCARST